MRYAAANYSMGTAVSKILFRADSDADAIRYAEAQMPKANALPGQAPTAAARARVIGVRRLP